MQKQAKIALEDGRIFKGYSVGAAGETCGEIVFNTSLTGYQEILTDPSYKGQIVTMTYPLIGNYGVNSEDVESRKIFLEGFVVKEMSRIASNWRSKKSLDDYLKENNIVGIEGVDTRALTKHIRLEGAMKACISARDLDDASLVSKAKASPPMVGTDFASKVSCEKEYVWQKKGKYKVTLIDCGVKYNILRILSENGCEVTVVPYNTSSDKILAANPDGIMLSNGPGDPAACADVIKTVERLIGKVPIFGICLGHQILGLALGGKTYKLKFGHHGGNHPVKDLEKNTISITSQNHGFCVDIDSLSKDDIKLTHINLNDNTLEGMRHKKVPAFSVQFHPEYGPGPHDAKYLFKNFVDLMENSYAKKN